MSNCSRSLACPPKVKTKDPCGGKRKSSIAGFTLCKCTVSCDIHAEIDRHAHAHRETETHTLTQTDRKTDSERDRQAHTKKERDKREEQRDIHTK